MIRLPHSFPLSAALDLFDGMVLVANQAPAGTNHPHTLVKARAAGKTEQGDTHRWLPSLHRPRLTAPLPACALPPPQFPALMPQCKGVIRLPQDFGQVRDIRLRATGAQRTSQMCSNILSRT